jgi:hypothetical protein
MAKEELDQIIALVSQVRQAAETTAALLSIVIVAAVAAVVISSHLLAAVVMVVPGQIMAQAGLEGLAVYMELVAVAVVRVIMELAVRQAAMAAQELQGMF